MNGIINILKPPGMTSHDVVAYIRKITGIKKVGHTGTLDPGAAGVLPICIGKSTKIVDFIMNDRKTYICELKFGNKTDTYDKYGRFIYEKDKDIDNIQLNDILGVLEDFKGEITQRPPAYSAIKIAGKRSYDLAREGIEVEVPLRRVRIFDIRILNFEMPYLMLKIECSKGTYVRSICNDIGDILECGAYMNFLIRTGTGSFNLENSCILQKLNRDNVKNYLISPDNALDMKSIYIDIIHETKALNGNDIKINTNMDAMLEELIKIYIKPDKFIGIGRISRGLLKIDKLII